MSKSTTDVANEISEALKDLGFEHSPLVFDSEAIPDTIKDKSFRMEPVSLAPSSGFGSSIEVSVLWRINIAYQPPPMSETDFFFHTILPDYDKLARALIELPDFEAPLTSSTAQDIETRYVLLTLNLRTRYCMPVVA